MQSDKANGSYHGLSIYYLHLQMNYAGVHDTEDGTINMYPCWFQGKRKFTYTTKFDYHCTKLSATLAWKQPYLFNKHAWRKKRKKKKTINIIQY